MPSTGMALTYITTLRRMEGLPWQFLKLQIIAEISRKIKE